MIADQTGLTKSDENTKSEQWLLTHMKSYFQRKLYRDLPQNYLNNHCIVSQNDADRVYYSKMIRKWVENNKIDYEELRLSIESQRGLACMMGLAIGDALGASTQFEEFNKNRKFWFDDFIGLQTRIQDKVLAERSNEVGIWTDDCSMALAMATSLLLNKFVFVPKNIRYMFTLWLRHGLGNGGRQYSIGLGGNISLSMSQFMEQQQDYTSEGNRFTNGNGSLMRLAPIPIAYWKNKEKAIEYAQKSSLTTHQGDQAKQCCRLLSSIIVDLINRKQQDWKKTIDKSCSDFQQKIKSVKYLASSRQQTQQMFQENIKNWKNFGFQNESIKDRNWNWKDPDFTYSPFRCQRQPGYIGSYCMDALSMALHIVWNRNSFKDMVLWAVNMGGDSDTVGAIVGQIAGAIFGFNDEMLHLYSQMQDYKKKRYQILLMGIKLATNRQKEQSTQIQQLKKVSQKIKPLQTIKVSPKKKYSEDHVAVSNFSPIKKKQRRLTKQ